MSAKVLPQMLQAKGLSFTCVFLGRDRVVGYAKCLVSGLRVFNGFDMYVIVVIHKVRPANSGRLLKVWKESC